MINIDHILKFTEFLNAFRKVERKLLAIGRAGFENDVEHSYALAMLAWYINEKAKLGLDTTKLLKYSLVHDMVEVYAGDTFFYADQQTIDAKNEREHLALEKIKKEHSDFGELVMMIEQYEKREDEESKFIYALDKVEPVFNVYLDKGRTWHYHGIQFEQLRKMKIEKVKAHPEIEKYFHQLLEYLEEREVELFPLDKKLQ